MENMREKITSFVFAALCLLVNGCGTPSGSAGYRDPEALLRNESQPESLIEVSFGHEEAVVTKNVPEDAVDAVQNAIKSMRGQPVSEP